MYYLVRKVLVLTYEGPSRQHLQPLPHSSPPAASTVLSQLPICGHKCCMGFPAVFSHVPIPQFLLPVMPPVAVPLPVVVITLPLHPEEHLFHCCCQIVEEDPLMEKKVSSFSVSVGSLKFPEILVAASLPAWQPSWHRRQPLRGMCDDCEESSTASSCCFSSSSCFLAAARPILSLPPWPWWANNNKQPNRNSQSNGTVSDRINNVATQQHQSWLQQQQRHTQSGK